MAERDILQFPATAKRPVVDEYHGVVVTDDYRWLEQADDPDMRAWNDAQNRYSRAALDRAPAREPLARRFRQLYTETSADYRTLKVRGGRLFAIKAQPPKDQPLLVVLASPDDPASERIVLDPNELEPAGATSIDFFVPSLDGRLVAVALSLYGSEDATLHIYETATGHELGDRIPRVNFPTAGGSVAWSADGAGLYYTRYPAEGERPAEDAHFYQQIYYHALGTPISADTYVLGADFPRIAEIELDSSDDGGYLLATVKNGDGGEHAHYLRSPAGEWTQVTRFEDQATRAYLGVDEALYLISHQGAPNGRVLRFPLETPDLAHARVVIEERASAIQSLTLAATRLYVTELLGGPSQIRVFDLAGVDQGPLPAEPVATIAQVVHLDGDTILYRGNSYVTPPAWYHFDPADEEPARTALYVTSPANFGDVEVVRTFASSRDGTRVPLNIMCRRGILLDGTNPTLLYGYGGYGISLSPAFEPTFSVWLEQGGLAVVANLRGGGEYGEAWHRAGNLTRKQNVFDDFIACAELLIAEGYTQPERLAIMGGSNGGLLMGAALTQRPDLFRAVASFVGIYDMLRVELDPNGAFNVTEFGSVSDPEQFHALHTYSPYHNVVDGEAYPAVLFVTGENDGRVNPAHSRKMTARLQAATSSGRPILLRTSASSGHGMGTSLNDQIAEDSDVFAFLFEQLGMRYVDRETA